MNAISLGNDIVDLTDSDTIDLAKHTKFIQRVYSPNELEIIESCHESLKKIYFWKLWAAKEAAYKAIKRINPDIIFSPVQFQFSSQPDIITFENLVVNIEYLENDRYIHASGFLAHRADLQNVQIWISHYSEIEKIFQEKDIQIEASYSRDSTLCRGYGAIKINESLNLPGTRTEIRKDGNKPKSVPEVWVNGSKTAHLVSLSHHGRYCAILFSAVESGSG